MSKLVVKLHVAALLGEAFLKPSWLGEEVVFSGIADQNGVPFRFLPFLKVAFPIMLLQIAISAVYVWWRYL